jgi:nucleotide-binding universal stress UspA family protein
MPGTIVVGIDSSPAAQAALRWAAEEARLREAQLVAVHVWNYVPPPPIGEPSLIPMTTADLTGTLELEREAAQAELESAVAEASPDSPSVEIQSRLVEGDPAEVLETEAREADLLVVGSRGRSGIATALLGSVSRHVVDHAACPVVVVKAPS